MKSYRKEAGRVRVEYHESAGNSHAVTVSVRSGWNDACAFIDSTLSVEEARDLRYLLGRAIATAEGAEQ